MKRKAKSKRSYGNRTLKILWGKAAARCAVPDCRKDLLADETQWDPIVIIGDIAHIEASSNKGPRANRSLSKKQRDEYHNLILLCKNCHARLDGQKRTNTVQSIRQLRIAHERWVRASLPERGRSRTGWNVMILEGEHPIDSAKAVTALSPDFEHGKPKILTVASTPMWGNQFKKMRASIPKFLNSRSSERRYAIFPLAPVSACLTVGFLVTSRPLVRLFQYHRNEKTWRWPAAKVPRNNIRILGLPSKQITKTGEIAICFHLSARIQREDIPVSRKAFLAIVDVVVSKPGVHWLVAEAQLEYLAQTAVRVFEVLSKNYPNASRWHLFYAGPAPGAVKVGQQLNPTMVPQVQLYEFCRARRTPYVPSILLNGRNHEQ